MLCCGPSRLPSALALAALFALPTSSSAQTYGMTPMARPGTTKTTYREFDWTGLTYSIYYQVVGDESIYSVEAVPICTAAWEILLMSTTIAVSISLTRLPL